MEMYETALGRLVPVHERQTVLQDAILHTLYNFRMSAQNPLNEPMSLDDIEDAVTADRKFVVAALDALIEQVPPLVQEVPFVGKPGRWGQYKARRFRITGSGVGFVRNLPQGLASFL